ncbi:MAG: nucleotidyltransferase family protein [Ruminococcus sp.]|nr:nucleotidyltransferase family protein [Ruminococcus sp.]
MKTVGIVAEFNPFHNGHAYLLEQVRKSGADKIVVVMSGAAVQRGETACCSKYFRAQAAIKNGADLVVELSAPYSCSSAKTFADSSVQILSQLSIDTLAFGSEYPDKDKLLEAAKTLDELEDSELLRSLVADGASYPSAIEQAATEKIGEDGAKILASPNSTLAVEYIRALKRHCPDTDIMPIKRIGMNHNWTNEKIDRTSHETIESAFACGSFLRENPEFTEYIPKGFAPPAPLYPHAADSVLFYHLLTADKQRLMKLPEMSETVADRIIKAAENSPNDYESLLLKIKSKNVTLARIRRCVLHLALGIEKSDILPVPYIRILAFNERGAQILRNAKGNIPISTSLKKLEGTSENAFRISQLENRAARLMQLNTGVLENEYSVKITMQ